MSAVRIVAFARGLAGVDSFLAHRHTETLRDGRLRETDRLPNFGQRDLSIQPIDFRADARLPLCRPILPEFFELARHHGGLPQLDQENEQITLSRDQRNGDAVLEQLSLPFRNDKLAEAIAIGLGIGQRISDSIALKV